MYFRTEDEVAVVLYEVMRQFYTMFPEMVKHDLYVTGESYGGWYNTFLTSLVLVGGGILGVIIRQKFSPKLV